MKSTIIVKTALLAVIVLFAATLLTPRQNVADSFVVSQPKSELEQENEFLWDSLNVLIEENDDFAAQNRMLSAELDEMIEENFRLRTPREVWPEIGYNVSENAWDDEPLYEASGYDSTHFHYGADKHRGFFIED